MKCWKSMNGIESTTPMLLLEEPRLRRIWQIATNDTKINRVSVKQAVVSYARIVRRAERGNENLNE